jgi:hypothetical protein
MTIEEEGDGFVILTRLSVFYGFRSNSLNTDNLLLRSLARARGRGLERNFHVIDA